MLKIDKDHPAPAPSGSQVNKYKWSDTFRQMVPGDSFYFEGVTPSHVITCYGNFLARGRYATRREGNGYRFYMK